MDSNLAIKYITGSTGQPEKKQFEAWLAESEENAKEFAEMKKYWELSGNAYQDYSPKLDTAWEKLSKKTTNIPQNSFPQKSKAFSFLKIAASILILVAMGIGIKILKNNGYSISGYDMYSSLDEKKQINLKDGTVIWLNTHTNLKVSKYFSTKNRKVVLDGEAFFEVAKNAELPFEITALGTTTRVLGTSFNLRALKGVNKITISVETGQVQFFKTNAKSKKLRLVAGEKGIFDKSEKRLKKENNTDRNYSAWKTNLLQFKNTPLMEVCKVLNKHYNTNLYADAAAAEDYTLTASFKDESLDKVLEIINLTLDVTFNKAEDGIEIIFEPE